MGAIQRIDKAGQSATGIADGWGLRRNSKQGMGRDCFGVKDSLEFWEGLQLAISTVQAARQVSLKNAPEPKLAEGTSGWAGCLEHGLEPSKLPDHAPQAFSKQYLLALSGGSDRLTT
jgi:hypothetical protein